MTLIFLSLGRFRPILPRHISQSFSFEVTHISKSRPFSSSVPRRSNVVDLAVSAPTFIINAIHASSIPWWATIPTAAILVRGVFVYYVSALPARKRAMIRQTVAPLAFASAQVDNRKASASQGLFPSRPETRVSLFQRQWSLIKWTHHWGKVFGAPLFSWRMLVNFSLLVSFMEAIRLKCGAREGLLALLMSPVQSLSDFVKGWIYGAPELSDVTAKSIDASHANALSPDEHLAQRLQETMTTKQAASLQQQQQEGGEEDLLASSPEGSTQAELPDLSLLETPTSSAYFDATMQSEGLSWCTDLTLPDPTFVLPVLLSASFAANVLLRPSTVQRAPRRPEDGPLASLTLQQRIGLTGSMFFLFVGVHMPAGMMLYWIPNVITGWLQGRWLDIKYPLAKPIMPCRRPARPQVPGKWAKN